MIIIICALLFGGWVRCDHGGEVEIKYEYSKVGLCTDPAGKAWRWVLVLGMASDWLWGGGVAVECRCR